MPLYEFECENCGRFARLRRFGQSSDPANCPECGASAPRIFSVVNLRAMAPANRAAHERNERSAHAPHVCGSGCSHGHSKPKPRATSDLEKPALQYSSKKNRRPWMLGH
ncbi:MAG TPA: zinc ribbon domain-containing protein [Candidatus Limnocylindria bacterium]|nr:zinc ribbon domain-containing protein [Candidatus Limnocylindria bacterium]